MWMQFYHGTTNSVDRVDSYQGLSTIFLRYEDSNTLVVGGTKTGTDNFGTWSISEDWVFWANSGYFSFEGNESQSGVGNMVADRMGIGIEMSDSESAFLTTSMSYNGTVSAVPMQRRPR